MLQGYRRQRSNAWAHHELDTKDHICGFKAVSQDGDPIGTVEDYILDDQGRLRYLVVETGIWIFGKKILVPIGLAEVDDDRCEVILRLTKRMAEHLPAYDERVSLDGRYESNVLGILFPDAWRPGRDSEDTARIEYDRFRDGFAATDRWRRIEQACRRTLPPDTPFMS